MEKQPVFFVSAVTSELGACRGAAQGALGKRGVKAVVQTEEQIKEYREIRKILWDEIRQSDVVICLVGMAYGVEPLVRPRNEARESYTQMEFYLALEMGKPLYVFITRAGSPFPLPDEDQERRRLQMEHRAAVGRWRTDRLLHEFASIEEIGSKVAAIPIGQVRDWLELQQRVIVAGVFGAWMSGTFYIFAICGMVAAAAGQLSRYPLKDILELGCACLTIFLPAIWAGLPGNRRKGWALWLGLAAYGHALFGSIAELAGFHWYPMIADEIFTKPIFVLFGLFSLVGLYFYYGALRAHYLPQPELYAATSMQSENGR